MALATPDQLKMIRTRFRIYYGEPSESNLSAIVYWVADEPNLDNVKAMHVDALKEAVTRPRSTINAIVQAAREGNRAAAYIADRYWLDDFPEEQLIEEVKRVQAVDAEAA